MMKEKKKNKLSTELCRAALSVSMASVSNHVDDCTFLFYEPKQPKLLAQTDLKQLKKMIK